MKERLIEFLNKEQISASKFAETIDVQASSISHILSGRNKPGFDFLAKLFTAYPKLNPRWLMLGIEPIYLENILPPSKITDTGSLYPKESTFINPVPESVRDIAEMSHHDNREVEKVILFFSDNTFETYKKNNRPI